MNMPEFWHAEEWYELNAQIYSYIQAGILQPLTPYRDIPYSREPWSQVILTPSGKTRLAGDYPPPEHHREYLQRLTAIAPRLDNTERFYVEEALTAFTARLFPASLVMLGCAGEHLIERMADSSSSLVAASQRARYERELRNGNISNIWGLWWPRVEPRLGELFPLETNAARTALPLLFVSVKRARDEAGHPQEVRPSPAEARTALASFIESARFASGVLVWLTEHAPGPE